MAGQIEKLVRRAGQIHLHQIAQAFRERPYGKVKAEVRKLAAKGKLVLDGETVKVVRN